MGAFTDFVIAASDEADAIAEAYAADHETHALADDAASDEEGQTILADSMALEDRWPTLQLRRVDMEEVETLCELITGGRPSIDDEWSAHESGILVHRLPPEVLRTLAGVEPSQLPELARRWVALEPTHPDHLEAAGKEGIAVLGELVRMRAGR